MKNRRIVVALLVIAILCVGVGYAAVADTIHFTGKITHTPSLQLVWGEASYETGLLTDVSGTDTDTFTVSMDTTEWDVGATKTFTVDVKNPTAYTATNVQVSELTTVDNYEVTAVVTGSTTINAGGSTTVTVTVKMTSYPTTEVNTAFTFKVTAEQGT